jgi:FixJ family two-component response regulator
MSMGRQHTGWIKRLAVIVDDDPRVRESLQGLLSSAGIDVRTYDSATAAFNGGLLDFASCLITDICMPIIDGWELQRQTALRYPLLPLIFVTAQQDEGALRHAMSSGAFAFFYKPFDGEDLLVAVQAAIRSTEFSGSAEDS